MYPDSGISIIVEILQSVEPEDGIEAVRLDLDPIPRLNAKQLSRYHFAALAHDNDAMHTDILGAHKIERDSKPPVFVLHGEQRIQKFNAAAHDRVCILMALYRIKEKKVDLVVTFNVPTEEADGKGVGEAGLKLAQQDFENFVTSLRIIDDGLFAEEHP